MNRPRNWLIAGAVFLLVAGGGWWMIWARGDRQLAEVQQLSEQLWSNMRDENLTRDQRREMFDHFRTKMDALSPEQRDQFRESQEQRWMAREQEQLSQFFALSPTDRIAELDRQIDRMANWRQEREARRARDEASGEDRGRREGRRGDRAPDGGPGGGPRGGPGSADGDGRRGPPGGSDGPGGRGGDGGGRRSLRGANPQQVNEWRRARLDATTPQYRAQRDEYRRLMRERMQQRGFQTPTFGRG